jgi:hypothetical protein
MKTPMKTPMKTTVTSLLATIAMAFTASAAPTLLVETTITENHANGGPDVLKAPAISVESGKQATVKIGKLEYAVTPTLLDNGTVDLRAVLTERDGEKADRLAAPQIKAKLGKVAEIQIGDLTFTTKTSLAKQ